MDQTTIIGEYEVSYAPASEPALVIHHVVRGYDVLRLDAAAAAELGTLLAVQQKRIRELAGHRALFGAAGDVSLYGPSGQRACYLNPEQAARLALLIAAEDGA
jgi:hypothetical protein